MFLAGRKERTLNDGVGVKLGGHDDKVAVREEERARVWMISEYEIDQRL
jgi:hypothetical protein